MTVAFAVILGVFLVGAMMLRSPRALVWWAVVGVAAVVVVSAVGWVRSG